MDEQGEKEIGSIIRKMESDWKVGSTQISDYVSFNMNETLNKIDAYLNSKMINGEKDSLGRKKPFFNIVTAASNIWYRATDIDRKNIKIKGTNSKNYLIAFIAMIHLRNWMRKYNFGVFLNNWGRVLSRFGSAVPKFVEKDGELHHQVVSWNRIICDAVDFNNNPALEILELTEAQLRDNKSYDQEMIESLLNAKRERETTSGNKKDNKSDYIKVYEIHGKFPLYMMTDNPKDREYVQQMHVVSFVSSKKKGEYSDFTLFRGREEKSPYMITHLIEEDGRSLSKGAVESLFEAQWMMNHTMKAIKDQLDLASKLIFQTSDGSFVGQNVLTSIETGDIMIHKVNEPLTQINNGSHEIAGWQAFGNQWKSLSNEITGISESMLGNTAPAGTAWRQVEALLKQNESLFELMRENKGLAIEEMIRIFVIPSLKKSFDTVEEISATLEDHELTMIDSIYIPREALKRTKEKAKKALLAGETPQDMNQMMGQETQGVQSELSQLGNTRYFKPSDLDDTTWKKVLADFDWSNIEVDVTEEEIDTEAITTLNTLIQFIGRNPQGFQALMQMPEFKTIFNKTLALTGAVSPMEFKPSSPTPSPVQPQVSPPASVGAAA